MNDLADAIATHIFHNFKILNPESKQSICNSFFETNQVLEIENEFFNSKIYSAIANVNGQKFKLIGYHIYEDDSLDGCFIILAQMQGCPAYACLAFYNDRNNFSDKMEDAYLAYCLPGNNNWLPTTPFLQATFLAGMEQLKEMSVSFNNLQDSELLELLKSFMIHYQNLDGE